ncbi:hypothetical protein ACM66B_007050 [Microbotryomycetes sp. NB124-2]
MSFLSRLNSKSAPSSPNKHRKGNNGKIAQDDQQKLVLELSLPSPSLMDDRTISTRQLRLDPSSLEAQPSQGRPNGLANAWDPDTPGADENEEELRAGNEGDGRKLRDEKQRQRMAKALLSIEEATALTKECGKVIRERGLTTLGLFRPFRAVESPAQIRNLATTFLKWVRFKQHSETTTTIDFDARDIFSAKETQYDKLERFRKELAVSGIHDVVGVLKWGLRHLKLEKPFGGTSRYSLDWYHAFLSTSASLQHPMNAFNTILLPKLPPESQAFLVATLDLAQAVSAYSEKNAMSPRKFSRTIGLYVFGLAQRDRQWSSWQELHGVWQEAGDAFGGCLRAYLRSQRNLPPRLADIAQGFPEPRPASLKKQALTVELESKGHWQDLSEAWQVEQKVGRPARRSPMDVLAAGFGDGPPEDASKAGQAAWLLLKDKAKLRGGDLLSEETERIFDVVAGQAAGRSSTSADRPSLDKLNPARNTPPRPTRNRSYSMGHGLRENESGAESWTGQTSPTRRWFPPPEQISPPRRKEKSPALTGARSFADLQERSPRQPDSAWNEFATAGFSDSPNEIRLHSPGQDEFPMRNKSSKASKARELVSGLSPRKDGGVRRAPLAKPSTKVVSVGIVEVDEEFPDVWYDSLNDTAACASWPSGVIGQLRSDVVEALRALDPPLDKDVSFLLITDNLISLTPTPILRDSPGRRAPSVAESTMSMRWARRASSLFNVRTGKHASGVDDSDAGASRSPDRSSPRKGRALFAAQLAQQQSKDEAVEDSPVGMTRSSSRGLLSLKRMRKQSNGDGHEWQPDGGGNGSQTPVPPPPPMPSDQEIEKMALRASAVPLVAIMNPNVIPVDSRDSTHIDDQVKADAASKDAFENAPVGNGAEGDKLDAEMERVKAEADQARNDPSLMTAVQAALDVDPADVKQERADEEAANAATAETSDAEAGNAKDEAGLAHSHTSKKALAAIAGGVSAVAGGVAGGISALKRRATAKDHPATEETAETDVQESLIDPDTAAKELEAPAMAHTESQSTLDIRMPELDEATTQQESHVDASAGDREPELQEARTDPPIDSLEAADERDSRPSMDTVRQEQPAEVAHAGEPVLGTVSAATVEPEVGVSDAVAVAEPVETSERPTIVATPASPVSVSPPLQSLEFKQPVNQHGTGAAPPSPSPKTGSSSRMSNLLKSLSGPLVQPPNGNSPVLTPSSPTPSNASNKSATQKVMASMNGLLKRKKSTYEQEIERQQKEAAQKEEVRLRKLKGEEQVRKQQMKGGKAPELVSSVKKRVEEIEQQQQVAESVSSTSPSRRASASIANSLSGASGGGAAGKRVSRAMTESPTRSLKSPARRLSSMSGASASKRLSTDATRTDDGPTDESATSASVQKPVDKPQEAFVADTDMSALGISSAKSS